MRQEILSLYDSGEEPFEISVKLGLSENEVIDILIEEEQIDIK